jgi:hypothetical protein
MDALFHGGSNDIIGGRVRPKRPEISLSSAASLSCQAVHSFAERTALCHHNSLLPVSMTPAIHFSLVSLTYTSQKETNSLKFITGVNDTAEKLFATVNDTADKTIWNHFHFLSTSCKLSFKKNIIL